MAKKTVNINPTKIRLEEIEKDIAELNEQKNIFLAHWKLEKELIKTIRQSKESIENLKTEAEKSERGDRAGESENQRIDSGDCANVSSRAE